MSLVGIIVSVIVILFLFAILGVFGLYLKKVWDQYQSQNKDKKIESKSEVKGDNNYCPGCGIKLNNEENNYCKGCGMKLK